MAVITEDTIRELAAFRGGEVPVTSCYLDVDGRRLTSHHDYEHELEQLLRPARSRAKNDRSVDQDLNRIEHYVRSGIDRSHIRGLAFFSCSALDFWEVIALPMSVHSRLVINDAPAVGQLESLVLDYTRIGVLLADRQRARMFVFELGELTDHSELFEALPREYDHRGHGDQGYERQHHHVEELAHQHLRHAAQVAFDVFQRRGFEHLVVGGQDAIIHEVEEHLHPYLQDRLVGRIGVPVMAAIEQIRSAALDMEAEVDRKCEDRVVQSLRDVVGAGGKGVVGLEPVLRTLSARRVDHFVVSVGFEQSGWLCPGCAALSTIGPGCPDCGTSMGRIDDVVEESIEYALAQSLKVTMCRENADLDVLGRIGALLRY